MIFYLREIGARLDSAMTLQVLNDYGHVSQIGYNVAVPVVYRDRNDWDRLQSYAAHHGFRNLQTIGYDQRHFAWRFQTLRRASFFLRALIFLGRNRGNFIVIRENKHLFAARLLKRLTRAFLIGEMHESGFLFGGTDNIRKTYQRFVDGLDGLLLTNTSQRQYLEEVGLKIPINHVVLPNGVDFESFSAALPSRETNKITVTYTGQFTSWKNLPLVFAALSRLDAAYRLRLAGGKIDGDSVAYIAELTQAYGVEGRVDYFGFLHPDELISRVINGSSVLVVPLGDNLIARYATSPMKLVEYMATSIPIVAVNHPSVVALTGPDTVHLSAADPAQFANAIRAAAEESGDVRLRRIQRTKALARRFDHAVRARSYHAWLSKIAQQPGKNIQSEGG